MHRNRYKFHWLKKEFASLRAPSPLAGEVSSTRRRGGDLGAGDETVTRYPQTGDFITNVSARRGEGDVHEH
jgi:hypothetical protein